MSSAPWPPTSKYGDGVSRTDVRTWATAKEIQARLTQHYESNVMEILREQTTFCRMEVAALQKLKQSCMQKLVQAEQHDLAEQVSNTLDETTRKVMTWAAVFQEIYDKEDETYQDMAKHCQRFFTRCPEYGYPTDNSLEGSVYAPYPFVVDAWKKNARDYSSLPGHNKKKKKKKKRSKVAGVHIKQEPKEEGELTSQDILRIMEETIGSGEGDKPVGKTPVRTKEDKIKPPVNLVTTNANKREQKITKNLTGLLSDWPDLV